MVLVVPVRSLNLALIEVVHELELCYLYEAFECIITQFQEPKNIDSQSVMLEIPEHSLV